MMSSVKGLSFMKVALICAPLVGTCQECNKSLAGNEYQCRMLPEDHPATKNIPDQNISFVVQTIACNDGVHEMLEQHLACMDCAKKWPEQNGLWGWPEHDEAARETAAYLRRQLRGKFDE